MSMVSALVSASATAAMSSAAGLARHWFDLPLPRGSRFGASLAWPLSTITHSGRAGGLAGLERHLSDIRCMVAWPSTCFCTSSTWAYVRKCYRYIYINAVSERNVGGE